MINFTEKLCVCYTCCGPTYRKSALDRLTNVYFSHPNLYYSVLTDDKTYFKDLKMDNLVVHELKDYYNDYPDLEKNEAFLESTSEADYGDKFDKVGFRFPYSTYRFHLLEAQKFGVINVAFLSTDIKLHMDFITDELFEDKNSCISLVGAHPVSSTEERINHITEIIKRKYNLIPHDEIFQFDGAARFFPFQDVEFMMKFFNMWNDVVETLYAEDKMWISFGTYVVHDEFMLAVICDVIGIHPPIKDVNCWSLYMCYEISKIERFWTYPDGKPSE
jgi:hypothetical protein